jgi:hypothetical protein
MHEGSVLTQIFVFVSIIISNEIISLLLIADSNHKVYPTAILLSLSQGLLKMTEQIFDAIEEQWNNILNLYRKFEEKKPIMLFDIQEERIYAYPYEEFKLDLSKKSQRLLEEQYNDALIENKVVVFVRDNEQEKLMSSSYALQ